MVLKLLPFQGVWRQESRTGWMKEERGWIKEERGWMKEERGWMKEERDGWGVNRVNS